MDLHEGAISSPNKVESKISFSSSLGLESLSSWSKANYGSDVEEGGIYLSTWLIERVGRRVPEAHGGDEHERVLGGTHSW